jgi:predicted small lipoprotein YifL
MFTAPRRAVRAHPLAAFAALAALALSGCGQKGPLVLPDTDTSDVVIREAGGAREATPAPAPKPEPGTRAPRVPAPTQVPSETAPRSTTPR